VYSQRLRDTVGDAVTLIPVERLDLFKLPHSCGRCGGNLSAYSNVVTYTTRCQPGLQL